MKKILILFILLIINSFSIKLKNNDKIVEYSEIISNEKNCIIEYMDFNDKTSLDELQLLKKFKRKKENINIIIIFKNNYEYEKILEFMKENSYDFIIYYDYNNEFFNKKNIQKMPIQNIISEGKELKNYEIPYEIEDLQYIYRKF